MHLHQLRNKFDETYERLPEIPTPTAVLIQIASNDLVDIDLYNLKKKMKSDLEYIRSKLPNAMIILAEIFQRCYWRGQKSPLTIEKKRKQLNRRLRVLVCTEEIDAHFLKLSWIVAEDFQLFDNYGIHLTANNYKRLALAYKTAINYFLTCPHVRFYDGIH